MTELAMMEGFSAPERAQWLALVEKALKGADFERRLVARTADDLRIRPLYTRGDAPAGVGEQRPGTAPFLRGATAGGVSPPWDIRQIHAEPDPAAANAAILEDLTRRRDVTKLQIAGLELVRARRRCRHTWRCTQRRAPRRLPHRARGGRGDFGGGRSIQGAVEARQTSATSPASGRSIPTRSAHSPSPATLRQPLDAAMAEAAGLAARRSAHRT